MRTIAAVFAGAALLLSAAPAAAQDPFDDAMAMLETRPLEGLTAMETLAEAGDIEAVNAFAAILDDPPEGVPQNSARALRLWEQAVARGSDAARLNLGTRLLFNEVPGEDGRAVGLLLTGEGGRVDAVTGAAYLDLAAEAGDGHARQMQQAFAGQIAALNQGAVEAVKAAWLREHGVPS